MYEYEVQLVSTGETKIIFGYTSRDACERWRIDFNDIRILHQQYID